MITSYPTLAPKHCHGYADWQELKIYFLGAFLQWCDACKNETLDGTRWDHDEHSLNHSAHTSKSSFVLSHIYTSLIE